jgi:hypothetical protein
MRSGRRSWNDERLDELADRSEGNTRDVRGEISDLRDEIRDLEENLRGETNQRFAKVEAKTDRHFEMTMGALITGFVGLIITHFIG